MAPAKLKTPAQVKIMAAGGKKLAIIRAELVKAARVGVTTQEIDDLAFELIAQAGGKASFAMVPGYKWATCMNVNQVVVHGIPGPQKLKSGDIVGIDVGIYYQGFHTDTSVTIPIGKIDIRTQKFLEVGKRGLKKAIASAKVGKRIADVSKAMQESIEEEGYGVVKALTGHGIGTHLHEEPQVPCFEIGPYNQSPKLVPGMVLAIEIMYNQGTGEVVYENDDGWTIATADGKISGLFEETVAITARGPVVLTTA